MYFSNLSNINIDFSSITTLSFYIITAIYCVFSAILYYHWQTYATDPKVTRLTLIIYFLTTIPLLLIIGILLLFL